MSRFGKYLREKRTAAGLSLRDVAASADIHFVTLGEVERGVRPRLAETRWRALVKAIPGVTIEGLRSAMSEDQPIKFDVRRASPKCRQLTLTLLQLITNKQLDDDTADDLLQRLKTA